MWVGVRDGLSILIESLHHPRFARFVAAAMWTRLCNTDSGLSQDYLEIADTAWSLPRDEFQESCIGYKSHINRSQCREQCNRTTDTDGSFPCCEEKKPVLERRVRAPKGSPEFCRTVGVLRKVLQNVSHCKSQLKKGSVGSQAQLFRHCKFFSHMNMILYLFRPEVHCCC